MHEPNTEAGRYACSTSWHWLCKVSLFTGCSSALPGAQQKPWSEVLDRNAFTKPPNLGEVRGDERDAYCTREMHIAHERSGWLVRLPPTWFVLQAIGRVKKNITYFRVNYAVVMVACCALSFMFNPTSLFVLAVLLLAWGYVMIYKANQKLVVSGREIRWATAKYLSKTLHFSPFPHAPYWLGHCFCSCLQRA